MQTRIVKTLWKPERFCSDMLLRDELMIGCQTKLWWIPCWCLQRHVAARRAGSLPKQLWWTSSWRSSQVSPMFTSLFGAHQVLSWCDVIRCWHQRLEHINDFRIWIADVDQSVVDIFEVARVISPRNSSRKKQLSDVASESPCMFLGSRVALHPSSRDQVESGVSVGVCVNMCVCVCSCASVCVWGPPWVAYIISYLIAYDVSLCIFMYQVYVCCLRVCPCFVSFVLFVSIRLIHFNKFNQALHK